jgi:phospholipase D1/2
MEQRSESMSPGTRSPVSPGNPPSANGTAIGQMSKLRTELGQEGIADNEFGNANGKSRSEPSDYLNNGIAHQDHSPHTANMLATSSPLRQSNLKQANEPLNSFPFDNATPAAGTSTPPGRRSVQFTRTQRDPDPAAHTRHDSWEEDTETPSKDLRSIISKLKALTSSSSGLHLHSRSQSTPGNYNEEGSGSAPTTPAADRFARFSNTLQEEDSDADAEETADEAPTTSKPKKKRRLRKLAQAATGSQTVPNTPRTNNLFPVESLGGTSRPIFSTSNRRATDGSMDQRGHVSEGEGRDRLGATSGWRRGSYWTNNSRGTGSQATNGDATPSGRRPSNFRRAFTGLGNGQSDGDGPASKRPFLNSERATTYGAQKWRKLKTGLKLLSKGKEEHKIDYMKSAELMAELRAGAPAALILASMIQRDEHGNKRIPVLLEQLKLRVTDSKPSDDDPTESEKHLSFRIELEYGSGLNRMKWVIHRSLRDFANLHVRYKLQGRSDKYIQLRGDSSSRPKQPRFPKAAFPWFNSFGGLGDSSEEDGADPIRADETVGEATNSETERRKQKKRHPSISRRKSLALSQNPETGAIIGRDVQEKRAIHERSRKRLEQYMQEMIRWLIFRADSNRLCRFLELSALGVRLAAEGSYHGKEGYLTIQYANGLDVRRILTPVMVFKRHSPKWFLVRHSYIVCVDSPENMNIYDVYLVDPYFVIQRKRRSFKQMNGKDLIESTKTSVKSPQHHTLKIQNIERKMKLLAKNERQLKQFEDSINYMLDNTLWSKPNRFGSFAPVRTDCFAQWLVDGRDYMWNVSRAISMAKDVIYIHDWWLSPQLYMRRPAAISQKWRLDRLLKRKANEGVKIFIIIYRNVEAAIPIDSEYTKTSMLDLHPNVFVQRSPNQFKKNQFFYAHHEKICVVDHMVAFVGGIDLCFGRWDSPDHSVTDDKPTGFEDADGPKDRDHCQMWPGKDYSNPRVQDFFALHEPFAEMYDRTKTPRMPWHDISMQVVGQPARDLSRHFGQRWNYVLRGRTPTRPTPFLLPPPDYHPGELEELGLTGTCEVQILRSAGDWSLGLLATEHSIMTAYCKMIEESDHFVYIENQFFITSCETLGAQIVNQIGDAIVERIVRAHQNEEDWRCTVLIPLMPGFQNTVAEADGTSVRLIMQCQFRSICRGEASIFGRLRSHGIVPEDYIDFFSLRSWGKIGPRKMLVTEQLYIHAKVIIVDDRIALIGSANINERSMLGNRDSETAAVVRDRDMIWSTMAGKPYQVGRFAHTLRMRLMREHLGLDTDDIMEEERRAELDREQEGDLERIYNDSSERMESQPVLERDSVNNRGRDSIIVTGAREVLVMDDAAEGKGTVKSPRKPQNNSSSSRLENVEDDLGNDSLPPMPEMPRRTTDQLGLTQLSQLPALPPLDDTDIGGPTVQLDGSGTPNPFNIHAADIEMVGLDRDCMRDPLNDSFYDEIWSKIAHNNTKIFRRVFRCNPDNEVRDWEEYSQFMVYGLRFANSQGGRSSDPETQQHAGRTGPPGAALVGAISTAQGLASISEKSHSPRNENNPVGDISERVADANIEHDRRTDTSNINLATTNGPPDRMDEKAGNTMASHTTINETMHPLYCNPLGIETGPYITPRKPTLSSATGPDLGSHPESFTRRRRRGITRGAQLPFNGSDDLMSQEDAEDLLSMVQGHLVVFPYDWLVNAEANSAWLWPVDQVAPIQI